MLFYSLNVGLTVSVNNFCSEWMPKQYRTGDRWAKDRRIPLKSSAGVNSLLGQKPFIWPYR